MNVTIQLEEPFFARLESRAKDLEVNTNELIIKALEYFLYIERLNSLRNQLSHYAKKQGFGSEEDFYQQIS